jgi:hypothetical protein
MYQRFTKVGKRGKLEKTRYERYGVNLSDLDRTGLRKAASVNQSSITELNKLLARKVDKPSGFTDVLRMSDRIRYMSMKIMAEVIKFIIDNGGTESESEVALEKLKKMTKRGEDVQKLITTSYFIKITTKKEDEDVRNDESVKPRYVAEFLAYLRYYNKMERKKETRKRDGSDGDESED